MKIKKIKDSIKIDIDYSVENYLIVLKMIVNAPKDIFSSDQKKHAVKFIHEFGVSEGKVKVYSSPIKDMWLDNLSQKEIDYIFDYFKEEIINEQHSLPHPVE